MNTVGRQAASITLTAGIDRRELAQRDRRHDDRTDAGGTRRVHNGIAVGVEFSRVEVAVGIDQHATGRSAQAL